jgi:AAA+ superfamily predicted ATPase
MVQMHHEDRAGVNALIRGIDEIAAAKLSCLIVMCTNRLNAIDPAIRRRAAAVFKFARPSQKLRMHLLESNLAGADLSKADLETIAEQLGTTKVREYGCTFSDITQRFIPSLVLAAYPHEKITRNLALMVASDTSQRHHSKKNRRLVENPSRKSCRELNIRRGRLCATDGNTRTLCEPFLQ